MAQRPTVLQEWSRSSVPGWSCWGNQHHRLRSNWAPGLSTEQRSLVEQPCPNPRRFINSCGLSSTLLNWIQSEQRDPVFQKQSLALKAPLHAAVTWGCRGGSDGLTDAFTGHAYIRSLSSIYFSLWMSSRWGKWSDSFIGQHGEGLQIPREEMPPTAWAWVGFLTGMYKLMLKHILCWGGNGSGVSHRRRGHSPVCTGCSWVKGKGDSSCGQCLECLWAAARWHSA